MTKEEEIHILKGKSLIHCSIDLTDQNWLTYQFNQCLKMNENFEFGPRETTLQQQEKVYPETLIHFCNKIIE